MAVRFVNPLAGTGIKVVRLRRYAPTMHNLNRLLLTTLLLFQAGQSLAETKEITLLYTNDIESVYEPIEAFWRDDMEHIGGMPKLSSLVKQLRAQRPATFLLDAGDMFTGSLSKATGGALVFDLYSAMGYDAGNLGNHEFEYGWQVLHHVMQRARFPVLNANIFHEGTEIPFTRQYAILERDGMRIGVIGLMGVDAFINTMMKANRKGLYVKPPIEVTQAWVDYLKPQVDMVVLLTHQNRTAPMQTDKEVDPTVARGFDEDYALAGQLKGVDMIVGGHSDNGLVEPIQHPESGTWIGMTYGQGTHLGYARFVIDDQGARLTEGLLIPVNADTLPADPAITTLIEQARSRHPDLTRILGKLSKKASRKYYRESDLGNLMADMVREHAKTDVAMIPSGAIRADLEAGEVTVEEVLNVFPFTDLVSNVTLSGEELRQVFEKGLSLDYGIVQFSGVTLTFDSSKPRGEKLIQASIGGEPLHPDRTYTLSTGSFTATGGEGYDMLANAEKVITDTQISDVLITGFAARDTTNLPQKGRLIDKAQKTNE